METIFLHYDSKVTMSKTYYKLYNIKSRHISLRQKYDRQWINNNSANPFTKVLLRDLVSSTIKGMA